MEFTFHASAEAVNYGATLLILSVLAAALRWAVCLAEWWDNAEGGELTEEDRRDWEENNP